MKSTQRVFLIGLFSGISILTIHCKSNAQITSTGYPTTPTATTNSGLYGTNNSLPSYGTSAQSLLQSWSVPIAGSNTSASYFGNNGNNYFNGSQGNSYNSGSLPTSSNSCGFSLYGDVAGATANSSDVILNDQSKAVVARFGFRWSAETCIDPAKVDKNRTEAEIKKVEVAEKSKRDQFCFASIVEAGKIQNPDVAKLTITTLEKQCNKP